MRLLLEFLLLRVRRIGLLITCRLHVLLHELPLVHLLGHLGHHLLRLRLLELLKLDLHLDLLEVALLKKLSKFLNLLLARQKTRLLTTCILLMRLIQFAIVRTRSTDAIIRAHQA